MAQATLPPLPDLPLDSYSPAPREAIARAYKDATTRSGDAVAVGALARTLHAWEQWSAAHEAYARAQALAPRAFEWQYLDALVLQRLARHADAVTRLEQALRLSPDYLPARVALAESLLESGDVERSERLFDQLRREPAAEPAAEFGLGRIAATRGEHQVALAHLERAVALFPEWGAAHYALALSYRALGRRDEAQRALERHAQYGARWPGQVDPVRDTVMAVRDDAQTNLQKGLALADAGNLAGAIAAHEAALARDPSIAQAHANLISLYGRTRDWAKAEEHYRAVIALGFNVPDAHYDYGVLLGLQEKWDAAADAYRQAIAIDPRHARAHNNLGEILERQRDLDGAAGEYRQAIASQPLFRLARFNLGRMLIALGRNSEAIMELEKLTEPRDAEAPRYLFALATAYVRAGRKDEGIRWATDARALAIEHGQQELAAAIERDLARLK
ncbi:MAG TPA: tetratricopeptide repeat protein [Vicinamibacterales bacterium]|nr:tetratricopeptide repeat protein [Vicinamibacterales bacterium]